MWRLCLTILAASMAPWAVYSASMEFRLIDHLVVPAETKIDGFPFGGISGLDYDLTADRFVAISDARGGKFGPPRYYELDIQYTSYEALGLVVVGQHLLRAENGSSFPTATVRVDPEAIRLAPAGGLYWSSEGVVPKQGDGVTAAAPEPARQLDVSGEEVTHLVEVDLGGARGVQRREAVRRPTVEEL